MLCMISNTARFFFQKEIYELLNCNTQIFRIFFNILFRNTTLIHFTTIPTLIAIIISKQFFMQSQKLFIQFLFIRMSLQETTEFVILIFSFLGFHSYLVWMYHKTPPILAFIVGFSLLNWL